MTVDEALSDYKKALAAHSRALVALAKAKNREQHALAAIERAHRKYIETADADLAAHEETAY